MRALPLPFHRLLKVGAVAYPLLAWGLWLWTPLGFWGSAYLVLILELLPILGLAQLVVADEEHPLPKIPIYLTSCSFILILGWLGLLVGRREMGLQLLGLGPTGWGQAAIWTLLSTLVLHLLLWFFFLARRALGVRESRVLEHLLPTTLSEKLLFVLLSISAGVGEEVAFRGFAVPALSLVIGSDWGGALLSSVAFGLLHGYQGWIGVFRTGMMGFLLAATLLLSGSLWPAILAHALLDLISGMGLGRALLRED